VYECGRVKRRIRGGGREGKDEKKGMRVAG
jgi:hypothetical protein